MREFSWSVFAMTGNIEAYLLYRETDSSDSLEDEAEEELLQESLIQLN
jgi:hypothetical protein